MLEFLLLMLIATADGYPNVGIGSVEYSELAELISYALTDKSNKNRILQLAPVSEEQKEAIRKLVGVNLSGFHHTIDMFSIRHIMKEHGNVKTEASRGQIAVEPFDFLRIPLIIASPDQINLIDKTRVGRDAVEYRKVIDDKMYFIQEIRTGRKQLAATTLYKRKATR